MVEGMTVPSYRPKQEPELDYHGVPCPPGYVRWTCDVCTAGCNFEAMEWCIKRTEPWEECGFDSDRPESNQGPFAFIIRKKHAAT